MGGAWLDRTVVQIALLWMIEEAQAQGLRIRSKSKAYFVEGKELFGIPSPYPAPNATGMIHDSMNLGWRVLGGITTLVIGQEVISLPFFGRQV